MSSRRMSEWGGYVMLAGPGSWLPLFVLTTLHVEEMARREQRVVLRITPSMTFESPPRHVYKPKDVEGLTHGLGQSLPWNAQ